MSDLVKADARPGYVLPPSTWDNWLWGAEAVRTAIVACENGHTGTLSPAIHSIGPDGTVSPSCVCPFECPSHRYVRLVGWASNV